MTPPSLPGVSPLTAIGDVAGHHAFVGTADDDEVLVLLTDRTGLPHNPRTLERLSEHPSIATMLTSGTIDGHRFAVVEAPQHPLADQIGRTSGAEAVRWTIQIADALAAAHDAGIVHGSVSPATVGLAEDRLALILGFPLLVSDERGAPTGYQAPEVAGGGPPTGPADVYSLAATLLHLLTHEPPVPGEDSHTLRRRLISDSIPPSIASIVDTGLSADPGHRPTAEIFGAQLAAAMVRLEAERDAELGTRAAGAHGAAAATQSKSDQRLGNTRSFRAATPPNDEPLSREDAEGQRPAAPVTDPGHRSADKELAPARASGEPTGTMRGARRRRDRTDARAPISRPSRASVPTADVPSALRPAIRPVPAPRRAAPRKPAEPGRTAWTVPERLAPALWIVAAVCLLLAAQIAFVSRLVD